MSAFDPAAAFHPSSDFDPASEALQAQAEGLRSLARGLLADEHAAEDVVQDTWVVALTRPPAAPGSPGGWLRTVARSLALKRLRSDRRRTHREETSARSEVLETAAEADERGAHPAPADRGGPVARGSLPGRGPLALLRGPRPTRDRSTRGRADRDGEEPAGPGAAAPARAAGDGGRREPALAGAPPGTADARPAPRVSRDTGGTGRCLRRTGSDRRRGRAPGLSPRAPDHDEAQDHRRRRRRPRS